MYRRSAPTPFERSGMGREASMRELLMTRAHIVSPDLPTTHAREKRSMSAPWLERTSSLLKKACVGLAHRGEV